MLPLSKKFNMLNGKVLFSILLICLSVVNPTLAEPIAKTSCSDSATVVKYDYLGACGLTRNSSFTLFSAANVTKIRVWYNTQVGSVPLQVAITGPNGYQWQGVTSKGGCDTFQKQWCEGIITLNQNLAQGTYTVDVGSQSMCANPSGQTTLIVYGCPDLSAALPESLAAPENFRYVIKNGDLVFDWNAASGATGYQLLWGTQKSGDYPFVLELGNTLQLGPVSLEGLPAGTYYLGIKAEKNTLKSAVSNELIIQVAGNPGLALAPKKLSYTLNNNQLTLNWDAVSGVNGYKLYFGTAPGKYSFAFNLANLNSFGPVDVSSLPRASYYLAVTAFNAKNESPYSNEISVTLVNVAPSNSEVRQYIDLVLGFSSEILNGGLTEQLQPILAAVLGQGNSTCPVVKLNVDLSNSKDLTALLTNLPKPTVATLDYGQGCSSKTGEVIAGNAVITLDNLNMDSSSKAITASFSIVTHNVTKNGKLMSDGSLSGNLTANLTSSTGSGHIDLNNYLVSGGKRLSGGVDVTVLDKSNYSAKLNVAINDTIKAKLNLLAVKQGENRFSISTSENGTVNQYAVGLTGVVLDTDVCKAYPIAGTASFTANAVTQTATFGTRCDGSYSLQ